MDRNVVDALQTIYHLITITASRRGRKVLAQAAFYLNDQIWKGME